MSDSDSPKDLLDQIAEYALPGRAEARALPPRAYTDEALFELERARIYHRSWYCVGRAESFATPGDYLALTIAGEPVLVIRGSDGALHALSNVCRHRLFPLVPAGTGSVTKLTCGYHAWTYALDGRLLGAPCMSEVRGFDRREIALPSFRVEQWLGFVFVNLDADAAPLRLHLSGAEAVLANYDLGDAISVAAYHKPWAGNWKLAVENATESYHHLGLHRTTVQPWIPGSRTYVVETDDHWAHHRGPILPDVAAQYGVRMDYPTRLTADDRAELNVITVFPSFAFNTVGDLVNWLSWIPLSVDRTDVLSGLLLPPAALAVEPDREQVRAAAQRGLDVLNAEDEQATALLQPTAASKHAARGLLSPNEGGLGNFHRYLARELGRS